MSTKKYQIFLSSTFLDLQRERSAAVTAIMRLGHIPVGMELFPATDNKQWAVIEKAIREADYYVLMVGGRYGSMYDHRSYTEAEYDFAVEQGVPVIPLLLNEFEPVFQQRNDEGNAEFELLKNFRKRLGAAHTCQYWSGDSELSALLFQGLLAAFDDQPREGWIRGSTAASDETLNDLHLVTKQRDELSAEVNSLKAQLAPKIDRIADFSDNFQLRYDYKHWFRGSSENRKSNVNLSWREIFTAVGPNIMNSSTPKVIESSIRNYVKENKGVNIFPVFYESDLATIKLQLVTLGVVKSYNAKSTTGGITEFITLTDNGRARLTEFITQRKQD